MRILLSLLAGACGMSVLSAGAMGQPSAAPRPAASAPGGGSRSAYQALDEDALAASLQKLQMYDLLLELGTSSARPEGERLSWRAAGLLGKAGGEPNRAAAEGLIDAAIADYGKVIEANKKDASHKGRMRYYRSLFQQMQAEGLTKTEPYAQKIMFLLDNPADRQQVLTFTRRAMEGWEQLEEDLPDLRSRWMTDDDAKITGVFYQLEQMIHETHYRGAWLRFTRAIATPPGDARRKELLQRAVTDLAEFRRPMRAGDDLYAWAALLQGMAARELGKYPDARKLIEEAAGDRSPDDVRFRALFELAKMTTEERDPAAAAAAIESFREKASKIAGVPPIAVDMQSVLLRNHMYTLLSESARSTAPARAAVLAAQGARVLLAFVKEHPDHTRAFASAIGPRYEGQDPNMLPPDVLVLMGIWKSQEVKTPQAQDDAEKLFRAVLKARDANDAAPTVMAMGYLALLYATKGNALAAANMFRQLAETYPKEPLAKSAAWEAVRIMERRMDDPAVKPTDSDHAEYLGDLEVLLGNWGADKDVRVRNFALGLEYERIGRNADAAKVFDRVGPDEETYLPARMHSLNLRGQTLLDSAKDVAGATALVGMIGDYHRAAAAFRSPNPQRLLLARQMGAQMDLLAAQLQLEVLGATAAARAAAEQAARDWADVPDMEDHCLRVVIHTYLKDQNLPKAIELFDKIKKGGDEVVTLVVHQLRQRIESLDPARDAAELKQYLDNYARFAEMLHKTAEDRLRAASAGKPADWLDAQMYVYRQMLAGAYEYSDAKTDEGRARVAKGLEMYRQLGKQNKTDGVNIRGIARCCRKLGANQEAMNSYNVLVAGLEQRSRMWWKAQLERLRFAVEVHARNPEEMRKIELELQLLIDLDRNLGGMVDEFMAIRQKLPSSSKGP